MKNVNFKFSHCCVCNEKENMQKLIIHPISDINIKLKNMKSILKFNPKHHMPNDSDTIPQGLTKNEKHGHLELEGLLLAKEGISNIESNISSRKTFHAYLNYNFLVFNIIQ
jgi:hypothetical protein